MHSPNPDPSGRPSAANHAAGGPHVPEPKSGSTGSHRQPDAELPLSDLLRRNGGSSRRGPSVADLAVHLAATADSEPSPLDEDDAPTVINANRPAPARPAVPPPPYVVGEVPSVAGRRLGHFELIGAVGSGGMAAVLKARDLDLGRVVALKILPPEAARDPENVTRFKQEARAAAKLDHENIARVYYCGEDQGLHFIAFEFVEGITLRQMITRRGQLPPGECVRYMIQVAAGLNHAAGRGVIHRDIKPSNLVITPDGRAKIVDMGLARHLDAGSVNGGVTQSGVTLGTFDYISPEQGLDPRVADVRSDIYSLGCAFYHALTGRPPVPEGTAGKKLNAHQFVDPLDPRELNPAVPDDLAAVLARMMAKDPDRRYQTPTELIAHLKAVGAGLNLAVDAIAADAVVQAVPADARVLPAPPRLRLGWVAAAAAVAVAFVFVAVSASGPGTGKSSSVPPWMMVSPPPSLPADVPSAFGHPAAPAAPGPRAGLDGFVTVHTAEELADVLAEPRAEATRVRLAPGEYDLVALGRPVAFQGSELILAGSSAEAVRVKLAAPHPGQGAGPHPGQLVLKAATVTVRDIRFDVAAPRPPAEDEPAPAGSDPRQAITILDAGTVRLTDCVFLPADPASWHGAAVAGVGTPAGHARTGIRVERCLFGPGGVGLRVPTFAEVAVEDSGFGPCAAAIQVHGSSPEEPTEPADTGTFDLPAARPSHTAVLLARSSFMLDASSAAVEADPTATLDVQVTARYCVFAPSGGTADPEGNAVVRGPGPESPVRVQFKGEGGPNAYFQVDPVADAGRIDLRQRPWAEDDALKVFATPKPWRAFRLRVTGTGADPDLFAPDRDVKVLGARFTRDLRTEGGRAYAGAVEAWPPPNPAAAEKVWWPDATGADAIRAGVYTDLVKLLRDTQSGDTVLIRHTGPLAVEQQLVQPPKPGAGADRGDFHLTFKPYPGSTPVLAPDEFNRLDTSLFRVMEGQVTFEDLHFAVRPGQPHDSASAVTLVAGQRCTFRRCVFTLGEAAGKTAAVVTLVDPRGEMSMGGAAPRPAPAVDFAGCLIRGKGRAVSVPSSRPFHLDLKQCVTALNGPVVSAKAGGRDPGAGVAATVKLTQVTAFLGGPVVELHAGAVGEMRASGLVPTEVTADGCVFAAVPGAGRPLVQVEGTDLDPEDSNRVLKWHTPLRANRYANFEAGAAVAVIRPDETTQRDWDWNRWLPFAGEVREPVGKITFRDGPDGLKDLAALKPADAAVEKVDFPQLEDPKPGDAGADPGQVARPADGP